MFLLDMFLLFFSQSVPSVYNRPDLIDCRFKIGQRTTFFKYYPHFVPFSFVVHFHLVNFALCLVLNGSYFPQPLCFVAVLLKFFSLPRIEPFNNAAATSTSENAYGPL